MVEIEITDYDPRWPGLFEVEARALRDALPEILVVSIEHIGSTAVPGLPAKPVIDILVAVRSLDEARRVAVAPLEALGYAYWAENPKPDRLFFVKGLPPKEARRAHHVHIAEPGGEVWDRIRFRDYLRSHPDEAERYARLKRDLASTHRLDREAYTAAKGDHIAGVMAKARHAAVRPSVTIRPIALRDAQDVQRYASDPRIAATTNTPHPYPPNGGESFVTRALADAAEGRRRVFAILCDGCFAGTVGLNGIDRERGTAALDYGVAVAFWNRGVATAAARQAIRYAFTELGLTELSSCCLKDNFGSARVLAKNGFACVGEFHHADRGKPEHRGRAMLRFALRRPDAPPERSA